MEHEKIEKLLQELAARTAEPVSGNLAEEIKKQIPSHLKAHRGGMDSFNIVIDLRVSKLAAAAAIILTMLLWANIFERGDAIGGGIYNDCKLLLKHHFIRGSNEVSIAKIRYQYLIDRGKEAVFYGQSTNLQDSNAIVLQWKLSDGNYRVVFANLHEETVTAEELIKLQSRMLQKTK